MGAQDAQVDGAPIICVDHRPDPQPGAHDASLVQQQQRFEGFRKLSKAPDCANSNHHKGALTRGFDAVLPTT